MARSGGCEPGEVRSRILVRGRDAHQSRQGWAEALLAQVDECVRLCPDHTGFLGLVTHIDLHEVPRLAPFGLLRVHQSVEQAGAVQDFDHIGQADCVACLVGLQSANQVQLQRWMTGAQGRELRGCLLHPIFAKNKLPGIQKRLHIGRRVGFANGDQGGRGAPSLRGGAGDARVQGGVTFKEGAGHAS